MSDKTKVAILGGGMGAMAAAFALTSDPGWDQHYEVTLYQMGWRLGGKGASGRQMDDYSRILEHGLHIWMGFYDNSFRVMRQCYQELVERGLRQPDAPLGTWEAAFKKHDLIYLMEHVGEDWIPWKFEFPRNNLIPGDDYGPVRTILAYIQKILKWLLEHHLEAVKKGIHPPQHPPGAIKQQPWYSAIHADAQHLVEHLADEVVAGTEAGLLTAALAVVKGLPNDVSNHPKGAHELVIHLLQDYVDHVRSAATKQDAKDINWRRFWVLAELGTITVIGLLRDQVLTKGLDAIEKYDYRQWLLQNGCSDAVSTSAPIRGLYDLVFAYREGKVGYEYWDLGAGTAIRVWLSMVLDYKGAIFWKLQAGMGDTVFTPFFQVLQARGVKFEYFHKVKNLGLKQETRGRYSIDKIAVGRQIWLKGQQKDPSVRYQPIVDVLGLPCWPAEPNWDQFESSEQVGELQRLDREANLNLESYYLPWQDAEERVLERGRDFDAVVLAIPPGAHPYIASELIAKLQNWKDMVDNVLTCQTQAMQLWLQPTLQALGWSGEAVPETPVLGANVEPIDTWADMNQLVCRETWPTSFNLHTIAYFCGPMPDAANAPPVSEVGTAQAAWFPKQELDRVYTTCLDWVNTSTWTLWPKAAPKDNPRGLDWNTLVARPDQGGIERFKAQFFRSNQEPSERYVLSAKGSWKYRFTATDCGVDNLFPAGDWTNNGFLNAGCIEATTMSGLQAAAALQAWVAQRAVPVP